LSEKTIAWSFAEAFGARRGDPELPPLAEAVMFYGTLPWGQQGRHALERFADEFHTGNARLRVALHDEFYSTDGSRDSVRGTDVLRRPNTLRQAQGG
jgi:hypothetical protein